MSLKKFKYEEVSLDLEDNPEQLKVYNSLQSCVVLAGPGSGKTKVLTLKLARIMNEDIKEPRGLACITYSKECVREIEKRLKKLDVKSYGRLFIGTVHGFCLQHIIKNFIHLTDIDFPENFKIATQKEQEKFWLDSFNLSIGKSEEFRKSWLTDVLKYRRTYLKSDSEYYSKDPQLASWIEDYEMLLRKESLVDYDDIVLKSLEIIENYDWTIEVLAAKFPYLIIDEYQDLGLPLHRIIVSLYTKSNINLFAFGDPDQSIYGFTGANPSLIKELRNMEGISPIELKLNYRSSDYIVKASNKVLEEERNYRAVNDLDGIINCYKLPEGDEQQAEEIFNKIIPSILERNKESTLGDIAILYLDKNEGDILEKKIADLAWDFIRIDRNAAYSKTSFNRWLEDCAKWLIGWETDCEIDFNELLIRWEKFFKESNLDSNKLYELKRKLVNFLWRQKSKDCLLFEWLDDFFAAVLKNTLENSVILRDDIEAFEKLRKESKSGRLKDFKLSSFAGQSGASTHINLITLHSVKGLEFDYIILFGMDEGKIPRLNSSDLKLEEANRLFYVGMTRARKEIHITFSGWINYFDRVLSNGPSRFVLKLISDLNLDVIVREDISKLSVEGFLKNYTEVEVHELHDVIKNRHIYKHEYYDFLDPLMIYFSDEDKLKEYINFLKGNSIEFISIFNEHLINCLGKTAWPFNQKYRFGDFILKVYKVSNCTQSRLACLKILWELASYYDIWVTQDVILNELSNLTSEDEVMKSIAEFIRETGRDFGKLRAYDLSLIESIEIKEAFRELLS